ncbi:MAG: hypothetical protein AAGL66_16610 [Pseudomonadota bacterium]
MRHPNPIDRISAINARATAANNGQRGGYRGGFCACERSDRDDGCSPASRVTALPRQPSGPMGHRDSLAQRISLDGKPMPVNQRFFMTAWKMRGATRRVVRGESCGAHSANMRVRYRDSHRPFDAREMVGFWCAVQTLK